MKASSMNVWGESRIAAFRCQTMPPCQAKTAVIAVTPKATRILKRGRGIMRREGALRVVDRHATARRKDRTRS